MGIRVNFATGFEIPPFWLQNRELVKEIKDYEVLQNMEQNYDHIQEINKDNDLRQQVMGVPHFDKISIKLETEPDLDEYWYALPIDPVISVTGKNRITRRNVMKTNEYTEHRGSVKELWSQDDYEVNIAGVIVSHRFPENNLRIIKNICEARQAVNVKSLLLGLLGITRITIEDFTFPFTKGQENQMYTIKAYSDDKFDLFVIN